jgi:hypothetical protein
MANEVLNAINRNLRAFRHVSQEAEPVGQELGSTWYKPSEDATYKWVNNNGVYQWEIISGRRVVVDTVNPTITNDISSGFETGSVWINTTTMKKFTLLDDTSGAAVWVRSVDINGDTMNGQLIMAADPTAAMEAVTKQYADAIASSALTQEDVEDITADMFNVAHGGVSVTYDDVTGKLTLNVDDPTITISGAATGSSTMTDLNNVDVSISILSINNITDVNTSSATNGDIMVFDGTIWNNEDVLDAGVF